jgi:protein-arginine kinase activator protein McsA
LRESNEEVAMLCQRCAEREAEVFQTQQMGGKSYTRDLCSACAKIDYGIFLGALLQSQTPGAAALTENEEKELRRVLDNAAPPPEAS